MGGDRRRRRARRLLGFSVIETPGHRALTAGEVVSFEAEPVRQGGHPHRAVRVWRGTGGSPGTAVPASVAYGSELTLTVDPAPGP
ncbi:hypothetical protein [Micromonospora sp. NPDC023814]|uniref:hypothetical protein n=1 Tax=Micromonospora sp. NPDC023814 TaxID=3154596 RepID=UPI0033D3CF62